MAKRRGEEIYAASNISITSRKITAGTSTFAVDAVQSVWVSRYSKFATIARVVGVLAVFYGAYQLNQWVGLRETPAAVLATAKLSELLMQGCALVGVGLAVLLGGTRMPPYEFVVHANVGGQATGIYRTESEAQAQAIQAAIAEARGL